MARAMGGVTGMIPARVREHLRRLVKYGAVSVISSAIGLAVLGYLVGIRGTSAGWANVISTSVAAVPSFELNRRWSWGGRSGKAKADQVIPFFILTFIGLGLSTYVVHWAGLIATEHNLHPFHRTVAIESASLLSWGALWLIQYLILDRILFRPLAHALEHDDEPVDVTEAAATEFTGPAAKLSAVIDPAPPLVTAPPVADAVALPPVPPSGSVSGPRLYR